ncbi:MAG TPA: hypothetical protein VM536_21790 [Chloroflexia bacterium]|nr:hypothetical protein [Chloroflexia bacterium]
MNTPKSLSPGTRWALVIGLWVVVLALLAFAFRNLGWVGTWASGLLLNCLSVCDISIFFSLIAAAIHLSADTIRGRYPY